jgi:hypothetical protein
MVHEMNTTVAVYAALVILVVLIAVGFFIYDGIKKPDRDNKKAFRKKSRFRR